MESYIAVAKHSGRASWRLALLFLVIALFLIPTHMLAEEPHQRIKNIIVVYQENWSFDSLYGLFPGANGLFGASTVSLTQRDRITGGRYSSQLGQTFDLPSGSLSLSTPPQPIDNNVSPAQIDTRFPADLNTLLPYNLVTKASLQPSDKTGDIVHRVLLSELALRQVGSVKVTHH